MKCHPDGRKRGSSLHAGKLGAKNLNKGKLAEEIFCSVLKRWVDSRSVISKRGGWRGGYQVMGAYATRGL